MKSRLVTQDRLEACDRTIATDVDDDIDGFDWAAIFSVAQDEHVF